MRRWLHVIIRVVLITRATFPRHGFLVIRRGHTLLRATNKYKDMKQNKVVEHLNKTIERWLFTFGFLGKWKSGYNKCEVHAIPKQNGAFTTQKRSSIHLACCVCMWELVFSFVFWNDTCHDDIFYSWFSFSFQPWWVDESYRSIVGVHGFVHWILFCLVI